MQIYAYRDYIETLQVRSRLLGHDKRVKNINNQRPGTLYLTLALFPSISVNVDAVLVFPASTVDTLRSEVHEGK